MSGEGERVVERAEADDSRQTKTRAKELTFECSATGDCRPACLVCTVAW